MYYQFQGGRRSVRDSARFEVTEFGIPRVQESENVTSLEVIDISLNTDFVEIQVANYLGTSQWVINLERGQTESLLFATSKKAQ